MKGTRWCDRRLIESPVYYGVCLSARSFAAEMRRLKVAEAVAFVNAGRDATTHFLDYEGRRTAIVCIRGWEARPMVEVVGLLVHEGVHIWQEVKDALGERSPSPEFEAYSVQWIVQQLIAEFVAQLPRRRKR